eukprot:6686022-Pyramimonas_sp.AAC.1
MLGPIAAELKATNANLVLTDVEWMDRVINHYNDSQVATGLKISAQERAAAHTLSRCGAEARGLV